MILSDVPWTSVRDAMAKRRPCVAILPCGATEAHGPHLPLGTDIHISEAFARRAAVLLETRSTITPVLLPPLAYAPAEYASAFAGTISINADTAKRVITDIAASLRAQGFQCLALANSHFDPANVDMLREVISTVRASGFNIAFPDFTRHALARTLTDEFASGACHAGQFETSIVLAYRADLVDNKICNGLVPNNASLVDAMRNGVKTFAEAGGPNAYFGAPARATAEEGRITIEKMALALLTAVLDSLPSSNTESHQKDVP